MTSIISKIARQYHLDFVKERISPYYQRFVLEKGYFTNDQKIRKYIHHNFKNLNIKEILLKINAIGSLDIKAIDPNVLAMGITVLGIDEQLKSGDLKAVAGIAGIVMNGNIERNGLILSFASRYCSYHNPQSFPVFDVNVSKQLSQTGFLQATMQTLPQYEEYARIISTFREGLGLQTLDFLQLNKFLWIYGEPIWDSMQYEG